VAGGPTVASGAGAQPALALARAAAGVGLVSGTPRIEIPEEAAGAVVAHLSNQRLTGVLQHGVGSGRVLLPDDARAALSDAHLRATVLVLELERRLLEVAGALGDAGVEAIVLKGPSLAHPFYDPIVRTYGDLDLLVPVAVWRTALDVLAGLGFSRSILEPRPGFDERFGKGASHADPDGYEVDLHRTLALGPFGLWLRPEHLIAGSVELALRGAPLRRLSDTHTLIHVCLHAALGRTPPLLLPLRDVLQVAYRGTIDWDELRELAGRWRLSAPLGWAFRTASETLGVPLPRAVLDLDLPHPSLRERLALRASVTDRRDAGGIELATLLAIDGISGKAAYLRAMLVPDRAFRVARASDGPPRWARPLAWGRDAIDPRRRRRR